MLTGNRIWKQVTYRLPASRPPPTGPPSPPLPTPARARLTPTLLLTLPPPSLAAARRHRRRHQRRGARLGLLRRDAPRLGRALGPAQVAAVRDLPRALGSHSYPPYSYSTHTPIFLLQVRDLPRARLRHPGGRPRRLLRPLPLPHHGDEGVDPHDRPGEPTPSPREPTPPPPHTRLPLPSLSPRLPPTRLSHAASPSPPPSSSASTCSSRASCASTTRRSRRPRART